MTENVHRVVFIVATVLLAVSCSSVSGGEGADTMSARLRVIKYGDNVFIRSAFSLREDLVIRVGKGSNGQITFSNTWLLVNTAGMGETELTSGRLIHATGDDATPWNINGTYIGANHGCSDLRELTCKGHALNMADLGSEWVDGSGTPFYLIKIVDENRLWFLSENTGQGDVWRFKTAIVGSCLTRKDRGGALPFSECRMAQLRPACRIKKQEYLTDGKTPLKEARPVTCNWLDIAEEYDIINPASLLEDIVRHRGAARNFTAEHLKAVIRNQIIYRFYPNGANVIYYNAEALQDFNIGYMGFVQSAKLHKGDYDTHEYYIPKTTPFELNGKRYDFRSIQDYSFTLLSPLRFSAQDKNVENPECLPDRFIQFLGRKEQGRTVREVGYALGYSLIRGLTQPAERAKNTSRAIVLHTTSKSYPAAIDSKRGPTVPAGTRFECTAYRHYFRPSAQKNTTCLYWHEEHGDTVIYADYHKTTNRDVLDLPARLVGKKIKVLEKTPSLTLHTANTVPAKGLTVSVVGDYGYIVLAVK